MILLILIFIIGIILLLKCADLFVDGASTLAKRFGVSATVIGFTVVAFGTSLPELVVSMGAAAGGNPNLALGNVIGSNVANIAFILALCSFLVPQIWGGIRGKQEMISLILMFLATAVCIAIAFNGTISRFGGGMLLLSFVFALFIIWRSTKKQDADDEIKENKPDIAGYRDIWMTFFGLVGVIIGAQMVVSSAEKMALLFGVSDFIIGVTIVAVGTSLPELATSVTAVRKGEFEISAGNILGSNLFNCLMVLGASAVILPITVPSSIDLGLLAIFTIAVLPFLTGRAIITRIWGGVLLACYAFYILYYAGIFSV